MEDFVQGVVGLERGEKGVSGGRSCQDGEEDLAGAGEHELIDFSSPDDVNRTLQAEGVQVCEAAQDFGSWWG